MTWFTVDSTNAVEMVSPARYRCPWESSKQSSM
jgi:hypothetical protein